MTEHLCVDMIPPHQLHAPVPLEMIGPPIDRRARAVFFFRKKWPNGKTLRVRFMGGSNSDRDMVAQIARKWLQHAHLDFQFGVTGESDLRIGFEQDGRSWSYLGIDNVDIPQHASTMNFGWQLEEGTILHEFGHALGLGHEHQNPQGGIQWNEQKVIADLSGPPNHWDEATIRHNVLNKYSVDQTNGTVFDPKSVMLYFFPASWTVGGQGTQDNATISQTDASFISSTYPKPAGPQAVELSVVDMSAKAAAIGATGEEDLFQFNTGAAGRFVIETLGATDVVMRLFGPGDPAAFIAEDDDSGESRNARIERDLTAGRYHVQVRHFSQQGTGQYRIRVVRQ